MGQKPHTKERDEVMQKSSMEVRSRRFFCLTTLTVRQILDIQHSFQFLSRHADRRSKAVGASSFQEQPQTGNSLGIYD